MGCVMVQIVLHQFKGYDTEDGDFFLPVLFLSGENYQRCRKVAYETSPFYPFSPTRQVVCGLRIIFE